jgi:type II secretory pathway pseudopilin PulG
VLTLMMIALTAAAPRLAQQLQRDREIEMIHRGEQYARAIKRYYKKFGRYPGRIEDLENTNTIRFLRQRYKDPITGGPWRLVRYGEIQLLSPAGGIGTPAQLLGQANNPQAGSQSGLFNMNFGGTSGQQNPATAAAGANTTATPGSTTATTGTAGTTSGATGATTSGTTDSTGQNTGSFGQTGTGSPGQTTSSSGSLFSSPASSAQPGGGGGAIIGVASLSKKNGIHEFNKKSAYNEWFFVYDPAQDRGQLLHGPYNPQAFVGQAGSPSGTSPAGTSPAGTSGQATTSPTGTPPGMTGTSSPIMGTPSSATGQPSGSIVPATQ